MSEENKDLILLRFLLEAVNDNKMLRSYADSFYDEFCKRSAVPTGRKE